LRRGSGDNGELAGGVREVDLAGDDRACPGQTLGSGGNGVHELSLQGLQVDGPSPVMISCASSARSSNPTVSIT
jgi:hypothetical protein